MTPQYQTAQIGTITIGKGNPIILQSMCNTDTNDIKASVEQCIRIFNAGADMVRLTTQGMREVESLAVIKKRLNERGYMKPLVADVHFLPKVAEAAASVADKVRINPGNYIDRKYKGPLLFDKDEQERQTEIIRKRLKPLIDICRKNNTAIRVGVNHGSLSQRILSWYGDTPEGMVESAMEFIRVFREEDFHNLVISLKSSNSGVMIHSNRLLYKRMYEEGVVYPLHLGVTEAGADEDGRIKSAVGICSLLADGIGDTIRVSLTEEPEREIPVAAKMAEIFGKREPNEGMLLTKQDFFDPFRYQKRESLQTGLTGSNNPPVVVTGCADEFLNDSLIKDAGYSFNSNETLSIGERASDYICFKDRPGALAANKKWLLSPVSGLEEPRQGAEVHPFYTYLDASAKISEQAAIMVLAGISAEELKQIKIRDRQILILSLDEENSASSAREFFRILHKSGIKNPVILHKKYNSTDTEDLIIQSAGETGSLLCDGFGDGIWLEDDNPSLGFSFLREISFGILQATGTRISKTEYIACPSCGRTLFNIQETLRKVKEATSGMKGLKIAVMGCIVNGPGEMAGADYGYVGAGRGKISLYRGKDVVRKNIPAEEAVDALVELIEGDRKRE